MNEFIFVYITNPTEEKAKEVARQLLEQRLIACGNIIKSRSLYRWKGKIEDQGEYILLGKTVRRNWERIQDVVKKIHPYETPCVLEIPFRANEPYGAWLTGEVRLAV